MGFRNPITSAAAVDTRPGATVPGVRMYEAGDANARWGVLEFTDPATNAPATVTGRTNAGAGGSVQGGYLALQGSTVNATTGPRLSLDVAPAATAGYESSAHLSGLARLTVDAPVNVPGGTAPALPANPGTALVGGVVPADYQPQIRAGTFVGTANGVGILVVPFASPFPHGVLSALAFPGDTANLPAELLAFAYTLGDFSLSVRSNTGAQLVNVTIRVNYLAVGW